jgi:hypothetical protein
MRVTAELAEALGTACPRSSIVFTIAATLDVDGFFLTVLSTTGKGTLFLRLDAITRIGSLAELLPWGGRPWLLKLTFIAWTTMSFCSCGGRRCT